MPGCSHPDDPEHIHLREPERAHASPSKRTA
jgi:hypothetical protein